jgi:hypothetical protein
MTELILLTLFIALSWLWWDSMQAREAAVSAALAACNAEGLQFLDDTVGIASVKPARNADGRLLLQRAYDFEFSDNGDNRIRGSVVMLGRRVTLLNILPPRVPSSGVTNVFPLH